MFGDGDGGGVGGGYESWGTRRKRRNKKEEDSGDLTFKVFLDVDKTSNNKGTMDLISLGLLYSVHELFVNNLLTYTQTPG